MQRVDHQELNTEKANRPHWLWLCLKRLFRPFEHGDVVKVFPPRYRYHFQVVADRQISGNVSPQNVVGSSEF